MNRFVLYMEPSYGRDGVMGWESYNFGVVRWTVNTAFMSGKRDMAERYVGD